VIDKETKQLPSTLLRNRTLFVALFQGLLVFCSLVLAWFLRFDFSLPNPLVLISAAPILILVRLAAIARFGLLRGWWRYTGVNDVLAILKAIGLGSVVFVVLVRWILEIKALPRSIYVLEALLTAGLLAGVRLFSRILAESVRETTSPCKKVIVIGAGFATQMVLREINQNGSGYRAVGCLDDDLSKAGIKIHGVPVLGSVDQLGRLLDAHPVDEVLIAVPSATGNQMQRFVDLCKQTGVPFRTLPALRDIIAGRAGMDQFRQVDLEDLLGRDPVEIDLKSVREQIEQRVVVVTGAAGSIGSELCRQILAFDPAQLICVDQSETGSFYLQRELSQQEIRTPIIFRVVDVGDREGVDRLFKEYKPEIVFHAAAYKHVPIMEKNVREAVKNNIFSLLTLVKAAEENGCQDFILISSDKAVNPTSVMGVTKRIGELVLCCRSATPMHCVSVRFGNVLGSNGSVVPIFQEQLRNHRKLTVTHPDIERFFMTTREAIALVLQAFAIGDHGDILVLDMGKRVRILDLARTLIRLSGKSEQEVGFTFTGLREGEKLIEELFYPVEKVHPTSFAKIKRTRSMLDGWSRLQRQLDELRVALAWGSADTIRAKLRDIVPEYSYRCDHQPERVHLSQPPVPHQTAASAD